MGSGYESFLKNSYWILRHGKSIPNQRGLIVSSLENGVLEEYQLASDGIDQARLAGELFLKALRENNVGLENVRICYSPFSRTTHTAKVVASVLDIPFEGPQCKVILLAVQLLGKSMNYLAFTRNYWENMVADILKLEFGTLYGYAAAFVTQLIDLVS